MKGNSRFHLQKAISLQSTKANSNEKGNNRKVVFLGIYYVLLLKRWLKIVQDEVVVVYSENIPICWVQRCEIEIVDDITELNVGVSRIGESCIFRYASERRRGGDQRVRWLLENNCLHVEVDPRRKHWEHRFVTVKTFYPEMMVFEIHRRRRRRRRTMGWSR